VHLLVLNGPNLNLLGTREPDVYGRAGLAEIEAGLREAFPDVTFAFAQSNHEGALLDRLHATLDDGTEGVVLNPGAFGHTSVALRDAVAAVPVPVVEVHLSNVHAREGFRHRLLLAPVCAGAITGLGVTGYHLAVRYLTGRADG
jgi:3-dehydroquinate dehydratase-2